MPPASRQSPAAARFIAAHRGLDGVLARMPPSSFAFVMATGILSAGLLQVGQDLLAELLFWIACCAGVVLLAALLWRAARHPARLVGDALDPGTMFGFFTFVAGANVVGLHLSSTGRYRVDLVLTVVAGITWVALTYLLPAVLLLREHRAPVLGEANGSWFLWVVATQSMAIAFTSLARVHGSGPLAGVAVAFWGVGVMLYLLIATLVTLRLLTRPNRPESLSPTYWIFMGATAITVLAGSSILALPQAFAPVASTHGFVAGASYVLWAVGLWWIPLLVVFGIWRHAVHRYRLRYETSLWSIVFPLGMLATASMLFGRSEGIMLMVDIGEAGIWVAVASWCAASAMMVAAWLQWGLTGRATPPDPPPVAH